MRLLYTALALCLCLCFALDKLHAQWQADLSGYNIPSHQRGWQGNPSHFYIHAGYLSLNGTEGGGLSYLKRSLKLDADSRWRGRIRLDANVSAQSRAYILLSNIGQRGTSTSYLSLRVDGGLGAGVSLVSIDVTESPTPSIIQEQSIHRTSLQAGHTWRELSYDISLHSNEALQLSLNDHYAHGVARYHESLKWDGQIKGEQSFGILCLYDDASRQGMHFADLRIDALSTGSTTTTPQDEESSTHRPLLLSELMSYPHQSGAQYIELYNPNAVPISLKGYSIGIGKRDAPLEYSSLEMLEAVPAEGYVVLSHDTQSLTKLHPHLPWGRERWVDLAHMPEHSGSIRLYRDGKLVSQLDYHPELHHHRLRRSRGVALECNNLEAIATESAPPQWQSASAREGYASPGYPAALHPTWEPDHRGGHMYQLMDIIHQAEPDGGASLSLSIYTMAGETLVRMARMDALSFLRHLHENPTSTLANIPTVYQGVAVLSVVLHSRIPKRYSLKFILR